MNTTSFHSKTNAPNSASAAASMTALMIVATVNIAPLLGAEVQLFGRKKSPPAHLRAFFSFAHPTLLRRTYSIILLAFLVCHYCFLLHCETI
jgi:hypothetical protein